MWRGKSADVRGAAPLLAESLTTARALGATGTIVVRGDSTFYSAEVVKVALRREAEVSLTVPASPARDAAIARIEETEWIPIHYPNAFVDEDTGELISDAEVAETEYTASTSRPKRDQVAGRLIVRRVKRLNRPGDQAQGTLFDTYRYRAVFVTGTFELLQAEAHHRGHAIVEQVLADAGASALAQLPSGSLNVNVTWALLWAIAHNLTRAAGVLTGGSHARATTATLRAHPINIPGRLARPARRLTIHLPERWPWQIAVTGLHTAVTAIARPPTVTA
jgi:hypothetical protein